MAVLRKLRTCGRSTLPIVSVRRSCAAKAAAGVARCRVSPLKFGIPTPRKPTVCGAVLHRLPQTQDIQSTANSATSTPGNYHAEQETCLPLYIYLSPDVISPGNSLSYPEALRSGLKALKCLGVNGVAVDVWWGVVEAENPKSYDWSAYHALFRLVRECGLKAKVQICFHGHGNISLPPWVLDEGRNDPDIFYTDRYGNRNSNYLTLAVDDVPVLRGRTALDAYTDMMRSFKQELGAWLGTTITEAVIGLGPEGELKYPAHSPTAGWAFPGTGEFQCYDRYMMAGLQSCAQQVGSTSWGKGGPHDAGSYCQWPHQSQFFNHHNGSWDTAYGAFFLQWYSSMLLRHADHVLGAASTVFRGTGVKLGARLPAIHWWYNQSSHAAELTAGYYNTVNRDGYFLVLQCLQRHNATCHLGAAEMRNCEQPDYSLSDPQSLLLQLRTCAAAIQVPVILENQLLRYDEAALSQVEHNLFDPLTSRGMDLPPVNGLVFHRLCDQMFEPSNWKLMKKFIRRVRERAEAMDAANNASRLHRAGQGSGAAGSFVGGKALAGDMQKVTVMA